jgi:Flp pilus assembly protein TadG
MTAVPGFTWKAARSRMGRIAAAFGGFGRDGRGTVAIQTLIFSVLLFGTTGIVLDAGRVYATHSQMQAFADQVALAAANELDGRDDAIERARRAAFGDGGFPFIVKAGLEVGLFEVASVDFYPGVALSSRPQNDMREAFPPAAHLARATKDSVIVTSGDPVAAANAATVAVVNVAEKPVRSAVASLTAAIVNIATATEAGVDPLFESYFQIGAVAAASLERRSCAALSTLVFCNPWEGAAQDPLATPRDDPGWSVPGRSLMTFAPNFRARGLAGAPQMTPNVASAFPWELRNQLFSLTTPLADSAGLCSPQQLLALATEDVGTGTDYLAARERCLMARAHAETVCWGPGAPLTIAPADGDTVARALNTAFDNWPPPFDQALAADIPVGGTGLTLAQFFEPDRLATTAYESADRHGPDPATQPQQDGIPDYPGAADPPVGPYDTVPLPGLAPLANVHGSGVGYDPCHDGTLARYAGAAASGPAGAACTLDFVGDYYEGGSVGAAAVRDRLERYWSTMYRLDRGTLPGDVTTWYELYRVEKDLLAALDTDDANSQIVEYSPANAARLNLASTTEKYVKHGPREYTTATGSDALLNPGYERRRLRSAMVNCRATVDAGADGAGRYRVRPKDLRIMDVYLPAPPGIFCGEGMVGCPLDSAVETRLFLELVDDVTERPELRRYVAQLVR